MVLVVLNASQVIDDLEDDTKERNIITKPLRAGTMLYGKKCTRLDHHGNGVVSDPRSLTPWHPSCCSSSTGAGLFSCL